MGQIILHASDAHIEEDRDYYFSAERDKHNQVRPDQAVYSTTPFSQHLDYRLGDGKIGNFFFPAWANSLDRIYIGISVPLFANTWGSSFLLELLKVLKPGGSIVLPVYPEGQAAEKGYWSRSFLENIFLSRSRWRGMSNIYAENDGVMSMRVGRKWPQPMPGSAEWFFRERSSLMLHSLLRASDTSLPLVHLQGVFIPLCHLVWDEYRNSAIMEQIIKDHFDPKYRPAVTHIGSDYGLLVNDLLLSNYVSPGSGESYHIAHCDSMILESVDNYFSAFNSDRHTVHQIERPPQALEKPADLICISEVHSLCSGDAYAGLLQSAWSGLRSRGVLVLCETRDMSKEDYKWIESSTTDFGAPVYYSMLTACQHKKDHEISHYSSIAEQHLAEEPLHKQQVYRVYKKP
jgi:hypothetical protein